MVASQLCTILYLVVPNMILCAQILFVPFQDGKEFEVDFIICTVEYPFRVVPIILLDATSVTVLSISVLVMAWGLLGLLVRSIEVLLNFFELTLSSL